MAVLKIENIKLPPGADLEQMCIRDRSSIGDGSNNLLIAVLSALAELESQQKSEAIKNGIRWRDVYKRQAPD